MANGATTVESWRVDFTDQRMGSTAASIVDALTQAGVATGPAILTHERDATLGIPEILITIAVTSAAKAVIVTGLHALQRALEQNLDNRMAKRAQVILVDPKQETGGKQRFAINLYGIGKEALKEFVDRIVAAVNAM